jgi:hypothetical protein
LAICAIEDKTVSEQTTDWYARAGLTPDEWEARRLIDMMGARGYIAAGADLSFMSLLIEHALGKAREEGVKQ